MSVRKGDKNEQVVGLVLILLVVVIAAILTATNVVDTFHKKCETSSVVVIDKVPYKCTPVGEINHDTDTRL
jgi:hypothetical protein